MKTSLPYLFAAASFFAVVASASAKIERVVEKTFPVEAGGTLRVGTSGGNVQVQPSTDSTVKVVAKLKIDAGSDQEADEALKKLTLTIEQSGNEVTAQAKCEPVQSGFFRRSSPPVQVDFIVTAPASFASELKTSGGNVTVGDFQAKVNARTSGGDIRIGMIGAGVDASTSGGDVTLGGARAAVKLHTSGGNISAGPVAGAADLETSGGNIKIESAENLLRAHTSGGDITASVLGTLKGDCDLNTSGGNVTTYVDKSAAFKLDASTSGGRVSADALTITLAKSDHDRSRLSGDVNGGGPLLKLRSSGGNITLKQR
jgi:hypothetical protein